MIASTGHYGQRVELYIYFRRLQARQSCRLEQRRGWRCLNILETSEVTGNRISQAFWDTADDLINRQDDPCLMQGELPYGLFAWITSNLESPSLRARRRGGSRAGYTQTPAGCDGALPPRLTALVSRGPKQARSAVWLPPAGPPSHSPFCHSAARALYAHPRRGRNSRCSGKGCSAFPFTSVSSIVPCLIGPRPASTSTYSVVKACLPTALQCHSLSSSLSQAVCFFLPSCFPRAMSRCLLVDVLRCV
jgi:hypothetical protein